jgi:hypothetical protein
VSALHQIQQGTVEITIASTSVRFNMPDGDEMLVKITGSCDPRINAAYAYLFANLPFFVREPIAYMALIKQNCDVELL